MKELCISAEKIPFMILKYHQKSFSFNIINHSQHLTNDNKLTLMLNKTNYANTLNKIEAFLSQPDMQIVPDIVGYKKISELFFELSSYVNNPPLDKEDYLRVLKLQNVLIDKMIQFVKTKVVTE